MKKIIDKITKVLDWIFGYGIMIALFIGGISFFGYIVALIVGGEVASEICKFIYKSVYPYLVYGTSIIVLLGLFDMYLKGQVSLTVNDNKKKKEINSNTAKENNQEDNKN